MKVWIGDQPYDTSLDWTFREERTVFRLLQGFRPGDWWPEFLSGSTTPVCAAAIVGFMRANPLESPEFLVDTKAVQPESVELDEGGVLRLKLDFSDESEAATTGSPPAGGAAVARPRRRASQSRPKS